MIQLLAVMRAKQGREKDLEEAFRAFVEKVREEEGTLAYILHVSLADPAQFMFYESYADKAALKAHSGSPHMAALFGQVAEMLEGEPRIEMYKELARK
ncbi:MAG: putative quinol monooxygenase [Pseudomonadota bacterium]